MITFSFTRSLRNKRVFINKNSRNWYTIDALCAIFTTLDTFTKLVQYFYKTFQYTSILLQYFYNSFTIMISQNIVDTIDIVGNNDIVGNVYIVDY